MTWDVKFKAEILKEVSNFKANCRFKKVTDRQLFDEVFITDLNFRSFQVTLNTNPMALLKDLENYEAMQEFHQHLINVVISENKEYLIEKGK